MPRIPILESEKDPDLAAKTMGAGEITVLPEPLRGSFRTRTFVVSDMDFTMPDDASPAYVTNLIQRLMASVDSITWTVIPESPVLGILLDQGFHPELSYDPDSQARTEKMVWRKATVPA